MKLRALVLAAALPLPAALGAGPPQGEAPPSELLLGLLAQQEGNWAPMLPEDLAERLLSSTDRKNTQELLDRALHEFAHWRLRNRDADQDVVLDALEELLDAGADPNAHGCGAPDPASALHHFVSMGDQDAVEMLLERGAHPDIGSFVEHTYTPLHAAIENDDIGTAVLLLHAGASVKCNKWQRRYWWHEGFIKRPLELTRSSRMRNVLLSHGADEDNFLVDFAKDFFVPKVLRTAHCPSLPEGP